jgi:hypothetical protein
MKHLGDYDAGGTLHSKFTTYRPSTGAPFTLGGTPALSVYKDNGTTQSTAGITLTADFDGVAGLHHVAVDTSADGTFYSAGSHFEIVITTGTVDSVSVVGSCVASFSLRKDSALKPTVAARTLDVSSGGEAGLDWANIGSPTTAVNLSATNIDVDQVVASVSGAVGSVTGDVGGNVTGSVGTVNALAANVITAAATAADFTTEIQAGLSTLDAAGVRAAVGLASANLDTQIATLATAANLATVSGYLDTEIAAILADTNELQTDWANGGRLDLILDARASQASVDTIDGIVDSILVTTDKLDDMLVNSSDGWIYTVAALQDAPSGVGSLTAAEIADAVWEEAIADHSGTAGSTAEALNAAGSAGDPWITALPGAYTAGQAGYILGTNLNAQVSELPTNAELATALGTADDAVLAVLGTPAGASVSADLVTVAGYLDTEIAAIKAVTDKLDTMLENSSDGWIWTIAAMQQSPGLDAAGVRGAVGLASADLDTQIAALPTASENATAVMASTVEGTFDLTESARLWNAALAGKASGLAGTAAVFRDLADSKDRITATVDADGNRTAVTRDVT